MAVISASARNKNAVRRKEEPKPAAPEQTPARVVQTQNARTRNNGFNVNANVTRSKAGTNTSRRKSSVVAINEPVRENAMLRQTAASRQKNRLMKRDFTNSADAAQAAVANQNAQRTQRAADEQRARLMTADFNSSAAKANSAVADQEAQVASREKRERTRRLMESAFNRSAAAANRAVANQERQRVGREERENLRKTGRSNTRYYDPEEDLYIEDEAEEEIMKYGRRKYSKGGNSSPVSYKAD